MKPVPLQCVPYLAFAEILLLRLQGARQSLGDLADIFPVIFLKYQMEIQNLNITFRKSSLFMLLSSQIIPEAACSKVYVMFYLVSSKFICLKFCNAKFSSGENLA